MTRGRPTFRPRVPLLDPDQVALQFALSCVAYWKALGVMLQPLRIGTSLRSGDVEQTRAYRSTRQLAEYAVFGSRPRRPIRDLFDTLDPLASTPLFRSNAERTALSVDPQSETDPIRLLLSGALTRDQLASRNLVTSTQVAVLAGVSLTGLRAAIARGELAVQEEAPGTGGVYILEPAEAANWLAARGVHGFGLRHHEDTAPRRGRPTTRPRLPGLEPHAEATRLAERGYAQWLSITALILPACEVAGDEELRRTLAYEQLVRLAAYALKGKELQSNVSAWFASLGPITTSPLSGPLSLEQFVGAVDPLETDAVKLLLAAAFARELLDAGTPLSTSQVAMLAGMSRTGLRAAIERGELTPREHAPGTGGALTIAAAQAAAWLSQRGIEGLVTEPPRRARRGPVH